MEFWNLDKATETEKERKSIKVLEVLSTCGALYLHGVVAITVKCAK